MVNDKTARAISHVLQLGQTPFITRNSLRSWTDKTNCQPVNIPGLEEQWHPFLPRSFPGCSTLSAQWRTKWSSTYGHKLWTSHLARDERNEQNETKTTGSKKRKPTWHEETLSPLLLCNTGFCQFSTLIWDSWQRVLSTFGFADSCCCSLASTFSLVLTSLAIKGTYLLLYFLWFSGCIHF